MSIKKLRNQLGITQKELAELLQTRNATISNWENKKCPSYIDKLAEMALKQLEDDTHTH